MKYSFWKDTRGYWSVSRNETLPGPVAGYLIPHEGGTWTIEGDPEKKGYTTREEAAEVLLRSTIE